MLLVALLLMISLLTGWGAPLKYCVQVATDESLDRLKKLYTRVKDLPEARIEKRGKFFLLRVGAEERASDLRIILRQVRRFFPDAYIKKCEIRKDVVVWPPQGKTAVRTPKRTQTEEVSPPPVIPDTEVLQRLEKKVTGLKDFLVDHHSKLAELTSEVNKLKEEVKEQRKSLEVRVQIDKFAYSFVAVTLGFFVITWILIALLYKKVSQNSVENANLLRDLVTALKVLNLLSKGYTVKIERGRIMVYDPDKDSWREAD